MTTKISRDAEAVDVASEFSTTIRPAHDSVLNVAGVWRRRSICRVRTSCATAVWVAATQPMPTRRMRARCRPFIDALRSFLRPWALALRPLFIRRAEAHLVPIRVGDRHEQSDRALAIRS